MNKNEMNLVMLSDLITPAERLQLESLEVLLSEILSGEKEPSKSEADSQQSKEQGIGESGKG